MRKLVLTLSAVLMLVAFTFAGCNKSAEKAAPATKKAPATTTAPATK
jgi:uncharacterized lipoprotein NlpE involved in copper resistance